MRGCDGIGHTSRSSILLHVKANRDIVFQFASKLAEVRRRVVHVASLKRLRRVEAQDERGDKMNCVGPFYSKITVSSVLDLVHGDSVLRLKSAFRVLLFMSPSLSLFLLNPSGLASRELQSSVFC
jgi:hypothetical protein